MFPTIHVFKKKKPWERKGGTTLKEGIKCPPEGENEAVLPSIAQGKGKKTLSAGRGGERGTRVRPWSILSEKVKREGDRILRGKRRKEGGLRPSS